MLDCKSSNLNSHLHTFTFPVQNNKMRPNMSKRSLMKRSILLYTAVFALVVTSASAQAPQGRGGRPNIFAPEAQATGPIADFVKSMVTAFNNRDTVFFQKTIAPDAVWLDEDGHHLLATVWINRLLSANPARK